MASRQGLKRPLLDPTRLGFSCRQWNGFPSGIETHQVYATPRCPAGVASGMASRQGFLWYVAYFYRFYLFCMRLPCFFLRRSIIVLETAPTGKSQTK